MRLTRLQIQNFRSFLDQTITFNDYTCFVGPNGAGKSCILTALNVFFRNAGSPYTNLLSLTQEDFHHCNVKDPIRITLTFTDLSDAAQQDLKAYYRQGQLVISAKAVWNEDERCAEVKQYGSRSVMSAFAPFFQAVERKAKAEELRAVYSTIQKEWPELPPPGSVPAMTNALRQYEESHPEQCDYLEADTQFYGWSKGTNLLDKYVQWVYIPAVKDAGSEQEEGTKTALGQLLQRTIRAKVDFETPLRDLQRAAEEQYTKIIQAQQTVLNGVQESIRTKLRAWTHSNAALLLQWNVDPERSVVINEPAARVKLGDDEDFVGDVPRLGHGMQRAFLVAMLQELASQQAEPAPTLLLGFEEPELYQHPPQAQHIASLLSGLGEDHARNTQVVVTTHSPYFVSGKGFETVRMVKKSRKHKYTRVMGATYDRIGQVLADALGRQVSPPSSVMAAVEQIMQPSQRELFFTPTAVLVEGPEDVAFLSTAMHLAGMWEEFRDLGCHFVVAAGKTNLSRLVAIANELDIAAFVVFDSDGDKAKKEDVERNRRDNGCILKLCRVEFDSPLPKETLWADRVVMWSSNILDAVKADVGEEAWNRTIEKVRREKGLSANDVKPKNCMLVASVLEDLHGQGKRAVVLEKTATQIFAFSRYQLQKATD